MAPIAKTSHQIGPEHAAFSSDFQAAVRAELDDMLKAAIFLQSNRCKRFLSYVVLQSLAGNASGLKERTIGISVFDRMSDYDTGDDSIVRVTANEVRKRLGQYYAESTRSHPIQIELPRGSYVPEFRVQLAHGRRGAAVASMPGSEPNRSEPMGARIPAAFPNEAAPSAIPEPADAAKHARTGSRRFIIAICAIVVTAVGAVLGIRTYEYLNRAPDPWRAFLHADSPILLCIDTHQFPAPAATSTKEQTFVDMVLRKQIVALDDAAVLASLGATLGKKGIPFRVVGAEQTSLADLRRQPVILIGAIDNPWTMRLTRNLPYRIEVMNPPNSGASSEPIASIIDTQHPNTRWNADVSVPFRDWKSDYAVIARIEDATTGVPVLIEAGLGNDGTVAANELLTSDGLLPSLAQQACCKGKVNFEMVIETQMIDTKSGPPHVLRLACW